MAERFAVRLAAGSGKTFGVDDIACAAATTLGFWDAEGLDVTWQPVYGGVAAINAVLNSTVDVSYGGLGPLIRSRAEGKPVRAVVSMARGLAQNLVVQRQIETPDKLRGVSWALDGINALSHHMARLVVRGLGIEESDIDWRVVGPPPERIEQLLSGDVDVSLIRVEEAAFLEREHSETLHTLLGFKDLKKIVPIQPHGVLGTVKSFEQNHPEILARLTRGMIRASRALHDSAETFRDVCTHHVSVPVTDNILDLIWQQENESGGFAVNGEMSDGHWRQQLDLYRSLYPDLPEVKPDSILAQHFVHDALDVLGHHASEFDHTAR